jgi:hypothetical protein
MKYHGETCLVRAVTALAIICAGRVQAETTAVTISPANNAVAVNPDTHLALSFSSAPRLGQSGQIRIYDFNSNRPRWPPHRRHATPSRLQRLTLEKDAETIANCSNPSFVLDGWMPIIEKVE